MEQKPPGPAWPKALVDASGELALDCFEVVAVMPGSPADGHLQQGDLLLAMDGSIFRTASALHPEREAYKYQETRSLEMDAGERLDLAEGRGRISFDVLRASSTATPFSIPAVKELQVTADLPRTPGHEAEPIDNKAVSLAVEELRIIGAR